MKKIIYILLVLLTASNCNGQKNNLNSKEMRTFDIKKFEDNKGKQGYENEYRYELNGFAIREFSTNAASDNYELRYQQELTKEFNPYKFYFYYYNNGVMVKEVKTFNGSGIELKEYDKIGKLIKETDFDKNFKHTFEQIHDIVLKEKDVDIYDTRQAVALRHDTPNARIKKYYQIHVITSELVQGEWYSKPNYSFLIDDETGQILTQEDIDNKQKSSSIYKTHEGKSYTQAEWEAYEEKQYEEYCKRTGRPYTPKNLRTSTEQENSKSSFIAQDGEKGDDNTPKKKGFWDNLFG
jgi:hypothetical protein